MLLFASLLLTISPGCDAPPEATYPATGRVSFEGEPVKGAIVTFVPEKGRPATATSEDDGSFELSTFSPGDGAVAGRHTVTIIQTNPGDEMILAGAPSKSSIPEKYTMPQKTPFTFDVKPDGDNHFDLNMSKDDR